MKRAVFLAVAFLATAAFYGPVDADLVIEASSQGKPNDAQMTKPRPCVKTMLSGTELTGRHSIRESLQGQRIREWGPPRDAKYVGDSERTGLSEGDASSVK